MIKIVNLHKKIKGQNILNGINLDIEKGQIFALIGASGVGKSILLKHIIGLLKPDKGDIFIDGKNIRKLKGKKLKKLKDRVGIVFQTGALFDSMNVFDNVAFPLREKTDLNSLKIKDKVMQGLAEVGLEDDFNKYSAELSGGMIKRVALARCLIMEPEIVLFDEPTTGLDPITVDAIHNLIQKLHKEHNLTALIASHEIPEIFKIVDKVAMLHDGRIEWTGTPEEIFKTENPIVKNFMSKNLEEILAYCKVHDSIKDNIN